MGMIDAAPIHEAVAAVCPIQGVVVNNGQISIRFAPEATDDQKSAAQAIVAGWDVSTTKDDAERAWVQTTLKDVIQNKRTMTAVEVTRMLVAICRRLA